MAVSFSNAAFFITVIDVLWLCGNSKFFVVKKVSWIKVGGDVYCGK